MQSSSSHALKTGFDVPTHVLPRSSALAQLRRRLGSERKRIRHEFETRRLTGVETARALSHLMDCIAVELAQYAGLPHEEATNEEHETFCLCATGGYGAGLLAPFSDVDLLFLTADSPSEHLLHQIEYVLYTLWDLGLRVGHATRSHTACLEQATKDLMTCTSLLDLRPVYGQKNCAEHLLHELRSYLSGPTLEHFVTHAITQREERHQKYGASPYLVEPHVKAGRGGIRDLQILNWIGRASLGFLISHATPLRRELGLAPACVLLGLSTERETYRAEKVWNFLWTIRLHLHYVTGRNEERLTFDVQPIVGARMGYADHGRQQGVERFMRHYFLIARSVMRLTHTLQPAILLYLQNQQRGRPPRIESGPEEFCRIDGCLSVTDPTSFIREPRNLFRLLDCARRYQLPLHPSAIQKLNRFEHHTKAIRRDPETNKLFLELLCAPAPHTSEAPSSNKEQNFWLPILNETGLLPRLIPCWSRILGRTQFDGYHIYTVDKHTIESIRVLRQLEVGHMADEIPIVYDLARHVQARRALFVATLLHDIGKGRGGGHSETGALVAVPICRRLNLTSDENDTVSWLILHHLLLSHTAFTRDIDDPYTILDLADIIQSPERLRLLLLLTIADLRAVGPRAWNAWKATLLYRLYSRIADVLDGGMKANENDDRVEQARSLAREAIGISLPERHINQFLKLGKPGYWLGFDTQTHLRHAHLVHDYFTHSPNTNHAITIDIHPFPSKGITELTIICPDKAGVFSKIAGALALCGASIADARIHTLSNGIVLDSFWIQDVFGKAFEENDHLERLRTSVTDALTGHLNLAEALSAATLPLSHRLEALHIPSRVIVDNNASQWHTIIEVNGRDRPVLLHNLTTTLCHEGAHITSAHITTYGLRAVDVFYLQNEQGHKITDSTHLERLQHALLTVLKDQSSKKT